VIVEHGTSGSGAAAPLARDIMVEAFQRLGPARGQRVAEADDDLRAAAADPRRGVGILEKLWQIPWSFVLLLCGVAAVGYVALLSAASATPMPMRRSTPSASASAW